MSLILRRSDGRPAMLTTRLVIALPIALGALFATGPDARAQAPTCPGCEDTSPPPPPIPSVVLQGVAGLIFGAPDYGVVSFTATFLRQDDGRCWRPNYDQTNLSSQWFCRQEYPCVYELSVEAVFTAGSGHEAGNAPHVVANGSACGVPGSYGSFITASGSSLEILDVVFSATCAQQCTYSFSFAVSYGTPALVFKELAGHINTTTNLIGTVACDPCANP
ncbi:MAG: hypothetical protein GY711_30160 [bacterium]|nr:hypothetical protein [bacterium]